METLDQLLTVQMLAALGAVAGELVSSELLVAAAVATFFVAFATMFVQMTTTFLVGLGRSDGRATVH